MKVLFDYQGFIQHVGGVSRYHIELIKHFSPNVQSILPPIFSNNIYLKDIGVKQINPFLRKRHSKFIENVYKSLNQLLDICYLEKGNYDIFHPTFLNPYYISHVKGKPTVITIHDLIHEKMERFDSEIVKKKREKVLKKADAIIAISEQTKDDLLHFYDVDENKIKVIYHGIDSTPIVNNDTPLCQKPYLLYIGTRQYHKNFMTFIKAFAKINRDLFLVCTGKPFNDEEKALIKNLRIENKVIQRFVSDRDLNNLLCHAIAFVYPSLMEGFGLPILEAYRCGCPCIISDIKCFREVAGDAAMYFNPESVDDMADVINHTIEDIDILNSLKEKTAQRIKLFTLDKTAHETEKVYQSLM